MTSINKIQFYLKREFHSSIINYGKRNFRKFLLLNKRGSRLFKERQANDPDYKFTIDHRGVRPTGLITNDEYEEIPEMIPDIIVPNLDGFMLKPYVSYRVGEIVQSEFTSQNLFDSIYAKKIIEDYHSGKLDELGNPLEPSEKEKLTAEDAINMARKTGSDLF